ncbi:MAG: hypothetical protein LBU67_04375 [Oscillospiraceae bacterium]|jgi:hypothetical protein|nr:hypothetical protein [Oscillospiraceae bacterium]
MKLKLTLDVALLLLFGLLCNTGATGTQFHEIAGLAYAALIGVHLILNRKRLVAAFKGKLRGKRAVWPCAVNIALFVDLAVILATGIRASHYLFPVHVKATSVVMVAHAVCGVVAALLVLTQVLLHAQTITKNRMLPKVGLAAVLIVVSGYSLLGGIQGALHHGLPKDGGDKGQYENRSEDVPGDRHKDGQKK